MLPLFPTRVPFTSPPLHNSLPLLLLFPSLFNIFSFLDFALLSTPELLAVLPASSPLIQANVVIEENQDAGSFAAPSEYVHWGPSILYMRQRAVQGMLFHRSMRYWDLSR
jgi:hypothetical protein